MRDKISGAKLTRAMEFTAFSQLAIYCYLKQRPNEKAILHILDLNDEDLVFEVESISPVLESLLSSDCIPTFVFEYKKASISFETTVLDHSTKKIRVKRPSEAAVQNQRVFPRTSLLGNSCRATAQVRSAVGNFEFHNIQLVNYSQSSIALMFDRQQGLALPGDIIESLQVFQEEKLVFKNSGKITRVDLKHNFQELASGYLAIIRFDDQVKSDKPNEERRKPNRVSLLEQSAFLEGNHPLFSNGKISGNIVDISHSGLSFLATNINAPMLPGMIFNNVEVQLPLHPRFKVCFEVVSCQTNEVDGTLRYRVGAAIHNLEAEGLKFINQTIQTRLKKNLIDAASEDYDKLWEFFFETGFVYSDKRKQLQDHAKDLFETYTKLLSGNSPILKKVLYKENGEIKGHVSGIRFFDNTWLIQHLNALKSETSASAAKQVMDSISDFFLDERANRKVGTSYMTCYYRPDNLFPSIVFGEIKNYVNNKNICDFFKLGFCLLGDIAPALENSEVRVMEAGISDCRSLESLLIEQGSSELIRIEGLSSEKITNIAVAKEFEKIGLYRKRRLFKAIAKNGDEAFAICNYSSPGLNLSELTNSFRIFYSNPEGKLNFDLADEISKIVIKSYQETRMSSPILLVSANDTVPRQFLLKKSYNYWYYNTNYMDQFKLGMKYTFDNMRMFIKSYSNDTVERKAS